MSIGVALTIYTTLIVLISSIMAHYYKVTYPKEEAKLREKTK